MLNITRGVVQATVKRLARDAAVFVYQDFEEQDDFTQKVTERPVPVTGLFVQLTDADIQRLQTAGITIQSGGYFSLPYEVDEIPGEIQFTAQRYTIVKSAVAQGVSVFLIDEKQIGAAEVQDKPTE